MGDDTRKMLEIGLICVNLDSSNNLDLYVYPTALVTVEDVNSGAGRVGVGRVTGVDTVVGVHCVLYEEPGGGHHTLLREQAHPSAGRVKVYNL